MLEAKSPAIAPTATLALAPPRRLFSLAAYSGAGPGLGAALGVDLPAAGRVTRRDGVTCLWSGPESWLAMSEDPGLKTRLAPGRRFAAITDQSDGRAIFLVSGPASRARLQTCIQIDLHESVFLPDHTALTLAGHIPVQIWREDDKFAIACFRSFAASLHHTLLEAETTGRG